MRTRSKHLAICAAGLTLVAGTGVAIAQDETPQTTPAPSKLQRNQGGQAGGTPADFERAARAAVNRADGGSIESIDRDEGGYEVEIRDDQGRELEVFVDAGFDVVRSERDDDERDDD